MKPIWDAEEAAKKAIEEKSKFHSLWSKKLSKALTEHLKLMKLIESLLLTETREELAKQGFVY